MKKNYAVSTETIKLSSRKGTDIEKQQLNMASLNPIWVKGVGQHATSQDQFEDHRF